MVIASSSSLQVAVRDNAIENTNRSETDQVSLRGFCGSRFATVNANADPDHDMLAQRAVSMAKVSPEDTSQGLADPDMLMDSEAVVETVESLDLIDTYTPDADRLEALALAAEKGGLSVQGVSKSMGSGASWGRSGFVLCTSTGFIGGYEKSGFSISAALVAGEGTAMERDYDYSSQSHFEDLDDAEAVGRSAGERTARRLGARQVKSGNYPIVFDPRISGGIVGALASAINGSSIVRKTSFLQDRLGKPVCADSINIIDDPRMKRLSGSKAFDAEGVPAQSLNLVENGILKTWLLDSATARERERKTNGRASRGGGGTQPSTTNCYMEPGEISPEDMISGINSGLYLTETIGHGINMVTGDYSKGAAGYWIENGEITHPVSEITVAGNLRDMFMNLSPANDLKFKYRTNAPTLLIEGMTIGGQ